MTREDIIRMALEANFYESEIGNAEDCFVQFAALVAAAEREECAKVCEDLSLSQNSEWEVGTLDCADAIRARGQA